MATLPRSGSRRGLEERLAAGETILCAEGYLLAFVRAGYVLQGLWVPEFVLDYPEVLRQKHLEFVRAGSDVTEAYQYYTNRHQMEVGGVEDKTEQINRLALRIAREVAEETDTLFAGGISNIPDHINLADSDRDPERVEEMKRAIYEEQVRWSKEEGVDYIIAETMWTLSEAKIALEVVKSFGLPAVVTMGVDKRAADEGGFLTGDGVPVAEACRQLLEMGATLVGVNCSLGPATMIQTVEQICRVVPPEKVCALPVAYRTTPQEPTWHLLTDTHCPENNPVYPGGLDPFFVSCAEIARFAERCLELGLRYVGICCGNTGSYTLAMARAMGKQTTDGRYHAKAALAQTHVENLMTSITAGTDKA